MDEGKHSSLPWTVRNDYEIADANGYLISTDLAERDARFIVTACNSHDALVTACREVSTRIKYIREALSEDSPAAPAIPMLGKWEKQLATALAIAATEVPK